MIRFEELQMRIMDAAKNYLDVYNMETLIEQYSLNKESKLAMTLPEIKPPYPISATVSFSYNAHQTSFSILFDEEEEEDSEDSFNFEDMVQLDVVINLPFLEGYNHAGELFEELINEYPELDMVLIKKEFLGKDLIQGEEYEIAYSYTVGGEELKDPQFYEEMFFELSNVLRTIYERTKFYIDMSWYKPEEDDTF